MTTRALTTAIKQKSLAVTLLNIEYTYVKVDGQIRKVDRLVLPRMNDMSYALKEEVEIRDEVSGSEGEVSGAENSGDESEPEDDRPDQALAPPGAEDEFAEDELDSDMLPEGALPNLDHDKADNPENTTDDAPIIEEGQGGEVFLMTPAEILEANLNITAPINFSAQRRH